MNDILSGFSAMPRPIFQAEQQFDAIKKYIVDYQKSLDAEHDVGLTLANFGSTVIMQVTSIGYEGAHMMVFRGLVNGKESVLIQNASQLNFLLTSVPKDPSVPHREIGFTANWAER